MDALTAKTVDAYLQAAASNLVAAGTLKKLMEPESIKHPDDTSSLIAKCKTPEELYKLMEELGLTAKNAKIKWEKYAPDYARKRTRSQSREEQLEEKEEFEGLGEPFTPPVSTEDVAGL